MNTSKKWMLSLSEDHYTSIRELADELDINGSEIVGEMINLAFSNPRFKEGLVAAQARIQLEKLEEDKAAIDAKIRDVRVKMSGAGKTRTSV